MRKIMSFVTGTIACLLLLLASFAPVSAQIGLFGGVPNPSSNIGLVRRVRVQGTNTLGQAVNVSYPLNGILNYVAYFDPTVGGSANEYFLLEGNYTLTYLDVSGNPITPVGLSNPTDGPINYVPNAGFTNGLQLRPANPGAGGPLGLQGTVTDLNNVPVFNAIVKISRPASLITFTTRTNANGFYSFYYNNAANKNFVPAGGYNILVTKSIPKGCTASQERRNIQYQPTNTTDPLQSSYFVAGARTVANFKLNLEECP